MTTCYLQANGRKKEGRLIQRGDRLYFDFGYWPALNDEIKKMEGRKYHGYDKPHPEKIWSIPITARNLFQLDFLRGNNPYARYDRPLIDATSNRPLYAHQLNLLRHGLTVQYGIWAAEMGTGKTLAAIELIEHVFAQAFDSEMAWYIAPKAALMAVTREFKKWKCAMLPRMFTYEALVKEIDNWSGRKAPRLVIFDESSRIKTPSAKRSQAAKILADGVRSDWGNNGYVIEMSGSPAPKSPADWWHQCEVACPGFIVEGNLLEFKKRIGIIASRENPVTGGNYAHLVTWKDDERKCDVCGKFAPHENHDHDLMLEKAKMELFHPYKASKNEVVYLYQRMQGLVNVKFKKDCLDLPEKRYVVIRTKPTPDLIRAAKMITSTAPRAVSALILLRELSDGFQYKDMQAGWQPCANCNGKGTSIENFNVDGDFDTTGDSVIKQEVTCPTCNGACEVPIVTREPEFVGCPKDDIITDLLEQHEEVGRIVIYAGFTASIDRLVLLCRKAQWATIRVDGRGWRIENELGELVQYSEREYPLEMFQDLQEKYPLVAFIGHPGSAGMGLTLTASPTVVYFSNDFSAESRIQSEDRIHRPGMDVNRGATIVDIINLPTDERVLDNLKKKRELQAMSLGELGEALNIVGERVL